MTDASITNQLTVRQMTAEPLAYEPVWRAMQSFTDQRGAGTSDEIWLLQHQPIFTLGQAGKPEHLLNPGDIPVLQVDRGGQVTYHGPGQLVVYFLLDIQRRNLGVRCLVDLIEQLVIDYLAEQNISAQRKDGAPGVFVSTPEVPDQQAKIASLGLRIRQGRSFHGLAFNIDMDLTPFSRINPCGFAGQAMTQLSALCATDSLTGVADALTEKFAARMNYDQIRTIDNLLPSDDTSSPPSHKVA